MFRTASRNTIFIMLSVLLLIVALLVAGLALEIAERDNNDRASIATDYLLKTRIALGLLTDMESGVRGYLLTGEEQFLEPYNSAQSQLPALWADMAAQAKLIDVYPVQTDNLSAHLTRMKADADRWQTTYAQPQINLRRSGDLGTAFDAAKSAQGKALFDAFREAAASLETQVRSNLRVYGADLTRVSLIREWLLLVLGVLAVGSAILALLALQRDARSQAEARIASQAEIERLRTVIENLPVAVQLLSAHDGEIALQNKLVSEMLISDIWHDTTLEKFSSHIHFAGPNGEPLRVHEYPRCAVCARAHPSPTTKSGSPLPAKLEKPCWSAAPRYATKRAISQPQ